MSPKNLSGIVYCLIALAVILGAIAGWKRYSPNQAAKLDLIDQKFDAAAASIGIPDGWTPVAGLPQSATTTPRYAFVCPRCQGSCWTRARTGSPACPFCGQGMLPQEPAPGGAAIKFVGAVGAGGGGLPIRISANAQCPHEYRGPCTNCHTVVGSGASRSTPAGSAPSNPNALWQAGPPPPITAEAVNPTLIEEFGLEVCPASGGAKVTGVMGNSYAARSEIRPGDIIIEGNGKRVRDVKDLQQLVSLAPPEANAQLKILRGGRTRDLQIMVGEGEMEGFTPIR